MKKSLLILILCLLAAISSVQAQVVTETSDISTCSSSGNGIATIDLTPKISELLNGLDAQTHSVTFYTTLTNADNAIDPIININAYTTASQTLFARVSNAITSVYSLYSFNITVSPLPSANPATLESCDPEELIAVYFLPTAIPQITNDTANNTVTFYETQTDAEIAANALPQLYNTINQGVHVIFARVLNISTGCYTITTLTLLTNPCTTSCTAPTNLTATNITETSFTLNWVAPITNFGTYYVSIVPQGSPADSGSSIATAVPNSFTFTGLALNTCYSVYVATLCGGNLISPWSTPLDICITDCTNNGQCAQALQLNAFVDSNTNGIKDDGEVDFPYGTFEYQVNDSGTNLYGTSSSGSYYIFDNNATNSYDISFTINSESASYYACTTTFNNITLPTGSGVTNLYFPVVITNPYIDASISIVPIGQPRPGFTYGNYITYKNNSALPVASGSLAFNHDAALTIINTTQAGTTPTADGFSFNFTNLAPFETRTFTITFQVPIIPTVSLGQLVTNTVTVTVENDTNVANNTATITQTIVGSYDPNDITESHGEKIVFEDFTADDYLIYTIQFENTGTANAEFIRIEDALDSQLDENTFELLSASHEVNVRRDGTALTFHFYGIDLPPSTININDGHGYVQFKIKLKTGYAIGDIIPNTASIFFDYNPPIVTNTFETEFVENLSTSTFTKDNVVIYPNPASNFVQIALNNSAEKIQTVVLMDILGKTIIAQQHVASNETKLNTSSLAKGMYLIKITSDTNVSIVKKLIIQ